MSGCSEAALKAMKDKRGELVDLVKYHDMLVSSAPGIIEKNKENEDILKHNIKTYTAVKKSLSQNKNNPGYKDDMKELNEMIENSKTDLKIIEKDTKRFNNLAQKYKKRLMETRTKLNKLDRKIISCKNKKSTKKRCPNGTHKNRKTGNCEKK